jgi:ABC-type amino acid transport system permease subunit
VLDAGPLGGSASPRSGGMVSSGQKLVLTAALDGLPVAEREAALEDSQATFDFLKDLVAREALGADLQLCGRFFGAFAPAHLATLRRNAETLHARTGVTIRVPPLSLLAAAYVEFIRNTPILAQLLPVLRAAGHRPDALAILDRRAGPHDLGRRLPGGERAFRPGRCRVCPA